MNVRVLVKRTEWGKDTRESGLGYYVAGYGAGLASVQVFVGGVWVDAPIVFDGELDSPNRTTYKKVTCG